MFRSPKLLRAAKDEPCVLCGRRGTTVAAHANSVALGKGRGVKAPDCSIAWVCREHHDMIDGRIPMAIGWGLPEELWLWAHAKTVQRWFERGLVEVK